MSLQKTVDFRATEKSFLFAFLGLRLLLLARAYGMFLGYDVRGHLAVVSAISWAHPFLPLRSSYYAWHPPFAFLLTHTMTLLRISPVLSAQFLSFAACLIAFFFMRMTLKSLGFLYTLPGILFLYIGVSIPLQIYLSVIVSLDVFVFCFMSIALFFSIQLFWLPQTTVRTLLHSLGLMIALSLAIVSKLSGFLLLPLPFFVFLFFRDWRSWRRFLILFLTTLIPFCIGFSYLYIRYYIPEHSLLFNSAGTFLWMTQFKDAVQWRDAHLFDFFLSYFLPVHGGPALAQTWASFWYMFQEFPSSLASESFAVLYYAFSFAPLFLGCVLLLQKKEWDLWRRFGILILSCAFIQCLGLFYYMYSLPLGGYISNKGIYIAPVSWAIAYLLSLAVPFLLSHRFRFGKASLTRYEAETFALWVAAFFMILNHFLFEPGRASLVF